MAQEYTVTKAFQATVSKEDKTPKSFVSHGQTLYVWKVQVAGNPNWLNVNKQEGNEIKGGDTLYGNIVPNQWNTGFDFKSESRPLEGGTPAASSSVVPPAGTPEVGGSIVTNDRLEYAIQMLEELTGRREVTDEPDAAAPGLDDLDI